MRQDAESRRAIPDPYSIQTESGNRARSDEAGRRIAEGDSRSLLYSDRKRESSPER